MRHAVAAVLADVAEVPDELVPGCARFFGAVFKSKSDFYQDACRETGVHSSTLGSRFYRAGLPSPKRFIAFARLVWAAHLAEAPGASYGAIAHRIGASSPQSFGRTVRSLTGLTAADFRRSFDGPTMLARFREMLVVPHRGTFRGFDPLASDSRATTRRLGAVGGPREETRETGTERGTQTARALGLEVPNSIQLLANQMIE